MNAEHRVIKVERHEWVQRAPAHHTEIHKAFGVAGSKQTAMQLDGWRVSDIEVSSIDDEEIVVSFTAERQLDA